MISILNYTCIEVVVFSNVIHAALSFTLDVMDARTSVVKKMTSLLLLRRSVMKNGCVNVVRMTKFVLHVVCAPFVVEPCREPVVDAGLTSFASLPAIPLTARKRQYALVISMDVHRS